jgi:hypothetical protein
VSEIQWDTLLFYVDNVKLLVDNIDTIQKRGHTVA